MFFDHCAVDALGHRSAGVVDLALGAEGARAAIGDDAGGWQWFAPHGVGLAERVRVPVLQKPASPLQPANLGGCIALRAEVAAAGGSTDEPNQAQEQIAHGVRLHSGAYELPRPANVMHVRLPRAQRL